MAHCWQIELPPTLKRHFHIALDALQLQLGEPPQAQDQLYAAREAAKLIAATLPGPRLKARLRGRALGYEEFTNLQNSIQVTVTQFP
jgi:hypothetical protein